MLAEVVAVVRREHDVGVLERACGVKRFDKRGNHLVDRQQRAQPLLVAIVEERDLVVAQRRCACTQAGLSLTSGSLNDGMCGACTSRAHRCDETPAWTDRAVRMARYRGRRDHRPPPYDR